MSPEMDQTPHAGIAFSNIQEQHITYLFALETLSFQKALDIGCGEGYGSYSLSSHGRVLSLDLSFAALKTMKSRYPLASITPLCMNATALGLKPLQFDLIMASHIIEHLDESERAALLGELVRVLHPEGAAVLATPNHPGGIYFQQGGFHKILYDDNAFGRTLGEYFESVSIYGVQEKPALHAFRPVLRAGKRVLQWTGLLRRAGIQNVIARTSTSSTSLHYQVTAKTERARNLIAICRDPKSV